jgi:hypothetical protein
MKEETVGANNACEKKMSAFTKVKRPRKIKRDKPSRKNIITSIRSHHDEVMKEFCSLHS